MLYNVRFYKKNGLLAVPVAGFTKHSEMIEYMRKYIPLKTVFDAEYGDKVDVEVMNSQGYQTTLWHPVNFTPFDGYSDYVNSVSIRELAETAIKKGTYDYAKPQPWVDQVVDKLCKIRNVNDDEKYTLYRIISGGTVWFYPREGNGRLGGRPLALLSQTVDALEEVYGAWDNES